MVLVANLFEFQAKGMKTNALFSSLYEVSKVQNHALVLVSINSFKYSLVMA